MPIPLKAEPKEMPSGKNQLTERSVGNPGNFVSAKNVPEKETILKIGIAKVGRNAEGNRRVLIKLRFINCPALRIVVECMSDVFRCVIEFVFTS